MAAAIANEVRQAAQASGLKAIVKSVDSEDEIDKAIEHFAEQRVGALVISLGLFFSRQRDRLVALSARYAMPMVSTERDFPAAGGLMSYGADIRDAYRHAGLYVARIVRGDKPADLPVLQPTHFELIINTKSAKSLGLAIPAGLLAIADEVIE